VAPITRAHDRPARRAGRAVRVGRPGAAVRSAPARTT